MPLSNYFQGSGEEVMSSMKKTYGAKKAKQVFYAKANKDKKKAKHKGMGKEQHKALKD